MLLTDLLIYDSIYLCFVATSLKYFDNFNDGASLVMRRVHKSATTAGIEVWSSTGRVSTDNSPTEWLLVRDAEREMSSCTVIYTVSSSTCKYGAPDVLASAVWDHHQQRRCFRSKRAVSSKAVHSDNSGSFRSQRWLKSVNENGVAVANLVKRWKYH